MLRGSVISPSLHVINVIYNYLDSLSSMTPAYGETEYLASTLLSSD